MAGLIVLAGVLAYANSLAGPFVFDDLLSIPQNPTIRSLWPLAGPLSPDFGDGRTAEGRPVLNLSFAINYALGGTKVWGYHAGNLLIHLLAALALFGVARRTLRRAVIPDDLRNSATWLGGAVALLWVVHPLQTEAVTYVVQRGESLAGLFYLLTVYGFIRGTESGRPWGWYAASVAACLLGIGTKEILVTAPAMVLLYDRTFVAGGFRAAVRRRWPVHLALFATWLVLAWLMIHGGSRGGTAGFGTSVSSWHYALTQARAVMHYLQLAAWPDPLVFDYGYRLIENPWVVLPHALALLGLAGLTLLALWRWPMVGFALAWVFVILAPTSSFVPSALQVVAERRMYLPLAGLLALAVVLGHRKSGRWGPWILGALALELGIFTVLRNEDYRTAERIWSDTVSKQPDNARAQSSLGLVFIEQKKFEEAVERFRMAVRLDPANAIYHNNLGSAFVHQGDAAGAAREFQEALRLEPGFDDAHANLGNLFLLTGRRAEAVTLFEETLRLNPDHMKAHGNLGIALMSQGRPEEALAHFWRAVELDPDHAESRNNLGMALVRTGRRKEALAEFRRAVALQPGYEQARSNLRRFETPPGGGPP